MLDLIIRNGLLPDGTCTDIAILDGKIVDRAVRLEGEAREEIDATGCLISPPFVDAHFHLDSVLTRGRPRLNQSGTLLEGIKLWSELKPELDVEDFLTRARRFCRWSIARGTLAIRSHVDITDDRLLAVEALVQLRDEMKPWMDIQLVAFPQDGFLRAPQSRANLIRALDMGVDVVGGIPHFERTMAAGAQSVAELCEIAADRGLMVDMHCDESDDPNSRHVESLAAVTVRLGLQGRVSGSHLTSMHSMDNYYVSKLIPLMAEAGLHVIANPLINITLQGRHDSYPKRRGMTRVKELMAAGLNVAFGHDCVMDPWYGLGSHDMLEVASMGLHVGQMTGVEEMQSCFEAVTGNAACIMGLEGYGLAKGCRADLIILDCRSPADAIRLRPSRLYVIRKGRVIAKTARAQPELMLDAAAETVSFSLDN